MTHYPLLGQIIGTAHQCSGLFSPRLNPLLERTARHPRRKMLQSWKYILVNLRQGSGHAHMLKRSDARPRTEWAELPESRLS
jgi:hypothetical protein